MYARIWMLSAFCAGMLFAAGAVSSTALAGGGNSLGAKACQKGGWASLVTSTGSAFPSEQRCVAYAAAGGTIYPAADAPCLNGGWQSPAQRGDGTPFGSQADCLAYASGGGHVFKPSLVAAPAFVIEEQNIAVTASGFHPNSAGQLTTVVLPSNVPFSLLAVTDGSGGFTASDVFESGACGLGDTGAQFTYTDGSGVHASASAALLCL